MKTRALMAIFLLGTLAAQTKEKAPEGAAPKPFTAPARETFTLKNGMKVSLVPYGAIPVVALSARMAFGNANEGPNEVWLADLLWSLTKEGAGARNGIQLAEEAARMGGQLSTGAGPDNSQATIQVLSEYAPDAVKLLADVLQRPTLPAGELERLRADLLRRLTVELSQPQPLAEQAYAKAVYGDHPYGRTHPTEAMLKSYTIEQVKAFRTANIGAKRTHLYVVGRFPAETKQAIVAAFEGWAAGPEVKRTPPVVTARKQVVVIDRPGAEQSTVKIGLVVPAQPAHSDYIPMLVADNILGGAFGSRITANIREDKGYTYSPFSTVATHYHTADWAENADVTTKVTGESVKEILSEIAKMRKEAPPADELKGIQNFMNGLFVFRNSSHQGIIGQLAFVDSQGLGDSFVNTYTQRVNAVTRADIQRVTESYLNPNKMTLVVVGDKAKIEESLKAFQ